MNITKQWIAYIGMGIGLTIAAIILGFVLKSLFGSLSVGMALVTSFVVVCGATVALAWTVHIRQNPG